MLPVGELNAQQGPVIDSFTPSVNDNEGEETFTDGDVLRSELKLKPITNTSNTPLFLHIDLYIKTAEGEIVSVNKDAKLIVPVGGSGFLFWIGRS